MAFNFSYVPYQRDFATFTNFYYRYTNTFVENINKNDISFPRTADTEISNKPKVFSPVVIYNALHKPSSPALEPTSLIASGSPPRQSRVPIPEKDMTFTLSKERDTVYNCDSVKSKLNASCDTFVGETNIFCPSAFHTPETTKSVTERQSNPCIRNYFPNRLYQFESQTKTFLDGTSKSFQLPSFETGLIVPCVYPPQEYPSSSFHVANDNNNDCNIFFTETNAVFERKIYSHKQWPISESFFTTHPQHPGSSMKPKQTGHSSKSRSKKTMSYHSGSRPFKCPCGRSFARNEELTRHERIHSGYKPHRCHVCYKMFGRKDHLNKHVKTHLHSSQKKIHLCEVPNCGQTYTRSDALARHQMNCHGLKAKPSKWRPKSTEATPDETG